MIKMYIAGEEVVCDKEFTIKEEMLSTSSTILNNCYPKSWEQDHDYISRFYYPKDYSKCLIQEEKEISAEVGEYAAGTNFNININNAKEWEYQLNGDTQQLETPTPTNPIQVETVTGDQVINIIGKNLFNNGVASSTSNATYNVQNDKLSVICAGANQNCYVSYRIYNLRPNINYSFSYNAEADNIAAYSIRAYKADGTYITISNTTQAINLNYNFTTPSEISYLAIFLYASRNTSGGVANNKTIYSNIQLEIGDSSTSYEPYKSLSYPISLGSLELCSFETTQDYIYYSNNQWYLHKEIEKEIFPSTDTTNRVWTKSGVNKNNTYIYTFKDKYLKVKSQVYSNMFDNVDVTYLTNNNVYGCGYNTTGEGNPSIRVGMTLSGPSTVANFRTWLSQNKPIFYYELATPMDIVITDSDLITQLNALRNATLYNGMNNIISSGVLPVILNIHYNFVTARTDTTLLFAGIVKNSGNISLNPREPKYCALEVLDFKDFLSTGEYLDFVISNKTVLEAIQMVVDAVAQYGFVLGNVNILGGEEIIGAYSTQEKSAYDVFQYLADITGSRWTTRMIDENTVAIDFYDPTLMPQGIDIEYTQEWWEDNQVNDLKFSYGSRDYRNKQVMLSNQVYGGTDYSETILGDGYNKNFTTTENIGLIKAIYVNGIEVSFSTNIDKELGIDTDFYYTPGQNVISSNENQESYSAGTQIIVTYTPLIKGREVIYNTDEVNRINSQIGRKGVVARYEQRNDILYTEDLEKIGLSYIKYKGSAEVILTLTTQVDIYNVGEIVYFNAPIIDLAQNYMVKRKSTQIIATGEYSNVWYTYELTSSFNSETAINWFDNQRNKVSGNISEGEYITRNIDIENTANIIWNNLTITEVTPVGDNILNAPLNSPFIQ